MIKKNSFLFNSENKFGIKEYNNILQVLNTKKKTNFVHKLENFFSKKFKNKYSIAHNSGTSTLHSCLYALGVGENDEVIVPAQTVIMLTFVIVQLKAVPVYADIDLDTFNIDPKDIERKISKKTKAIIAVHMHGLPADMPEIMKISKKYNIPVIEDSAQCVLGKINGKLTGTFGDLASYSFETKKHISAFEGGIVTTNIKSLAKKVRKFSGLGYKNLDSKKSLKATLPKKFQNPHYKRHDSLGLNYRMNEITAALALGQVMRVEKLVSRRIAIAKLYSNVFDKYDWFVPQKNPKGFLNSYWTYSLKYNGYSKFGISWKKFYDLLKKRGGDGFYGALSVVPEELILKSKEVKNRIPGYVKCGYCRVKLKERCVDKRIKFPCTNAYNIQPIIMQFKCNYRDINKAKKKIILIKNLIDDIEKKYISKY
jgi:perosamine synthetase